MSTMTTASSGSGESTALPWIALVPAAAVFLPGLFWPLVIVFRNSFWRDVPGQLPQADFTFASYARILSDPFYLSVFSNTAGVAILVTAICLIIAYPFSVYLTFVAKRSRSLLIWAVYLPLFISVIVRVIGWIVFLSDLGLVNVLLIKLGLLQNPIHLLYERSGMAIGMVHRYLPLMILPLTAAMIKIDPIWLAASRNLGASGPRTFWVVIVPLSLPGVVTGCQLVFAGVISDYVLPMLLGTTRFRMLAPTIYEEAITNFSWPRAGAMSVLMIMVVAVLVAFSNYFLRRLAPWVKMV